MARGARGDIIELRRPGPRRERERAVEMYWATTTFDVTAPSAELTEALRSWRDHIGVAHPKVREVRCYRYNGGTTIVWQEGFDNFHDYQDLIDEGDDVCDAVMAAVFRHAVAGRRTGAIWADALEAP